MIARSAKYPQSQITSHTPCRPYNKNQFPDKPAYIFIDSLTSIYLLITQLKQPTHHNDHRDQTILQSMIEMLIQRTQHTIIIKVKAHANIVGNEHVDKLAKDGNKLPNKSPIHPYEKAHSTPYYFHREIPDKGPTRHLQPYLKKCEKEHYLTEIA